MGVIMGLSVLLSFFSVEVVSSPVCFRTQRVNQGRGLVVYFPFIARAEFYAHNDVNQKQHCQQETGNLATEADLAFLCYTVMLYPCDM